MKIELSPCPFCEGPPVPFATSDRVGFDWEEDGSMVEAYVFCHECGAQGPTVDDLLYGEDEVQELLAKAVQLWQERDPRHRLLYDHSKRDGLTLFPRRDR